MLLEAFDGGDLCAGGFGHQRLAGFDGVAVEQNGAGAALAFAAAVLGSGEREAVAQDGEQGLVAGRADGHFCAVDVQNIIAHLRLRGAAPCTAPERGPEELGSRIRQPQVALHSVGEALQTLRLRANTSVDSASSAGSACAAAAAVRDAPRGARPGGRRDARRDGRRRRG